jgi:hypothetical protein
MKLYLDMCCLKRPFDDQTDARIQVETLALESLLQLCRIGEQEMIASDALRFENSRNPNSQRREFAEILFTLTAHDVPNSPAIEQRAQAWQNAGVPLLDALHLASAERAGADVFCTCDDVLLNRATRVPTVLRIVSLLDLFKELVP